MVVRVSCQPYSLAREQDRTRSNGFTLTAFMDGEDRWLGSQELQSVDRLVSCRPLMFMCSYNYRMRSLHLTRRMKQSGQPYSLVTISSLIKHNLPRGDCRSRSLSAALPWPEAPGSKCSG